MPIRRPGRIVAAAVVAVLAACTPEAASRPVGAPPASGRPSPSHAPSRSPAPAPAPAEFTLAFAGDVHFEGRVRPRLTAETPLGPMSAALGRADLAMVNLETSVTERGRPEPKTYTFRAPAAALDALRRSGVDVTTMANNHGVDFGATGLRDTLAAISRSPIPVVGIGANEAAAYAPAVLRTGAARVAVLGATQVVDNTLARWSAGPRSPGVASAYRRQLLTAVRAARATADVVVVYLHWGVERQSCPSGKQRALAAALAAAGADVVVGAHAHQLQGAGWLGRAYVAYGLGNFLWYSSNSRPADTTGVLTLTVRGRRVIRAALAPAHIDRSGVPQPVPATSPAGVAAVRSFDRLRSCTGLASAPG